MKKLCLLAATTLILVSCTDAQRARFGAYGDPGRVTCYSGGIKRFDDYSTGKIENSSNSDGYAFKSATTGWLVEASGDCTVVYGVARPADFRPTYPE